MPEWLDIVAWVALALGLSSSLAIIADLLGGHRQHMWIMNLVWPITALYAGPLALAAYFKVGRLSAHKHMQDAKARGEDPAARHKPFWQSAGLAATHCGSGCTLGDIVAEWALFALPLTLWGHAIFAGWVADYILAFGFGIAFQYFTLKPMRDIGASAALVEALKADTLSLTAWQIGMYGWMAIVTFAIFGHELDKTSPVFWFMMQIAMLAGFCTSYPLNAWLLKAGIKKAM
jgi:hypothetical protein